jgi:hypothetical protein
MTTTNREDWLSAAVSELRPFFDAVGASLFLRTFGWPVVSHRTPIALAQSVSAGQTPPLPTRPLRF